MIRGKIVFRCDECKELFRALDIEWSATTLSMPQQCPKCGSCHTLPMRSILSRKLYKQIWADMDNKRSKCNV
ncbi:hypothetical protein IX308_000146 [Porphyromonas levii]|uniref:hypothetical protein n=1 Tax=Porphyromonas levii TaxID=28114 RepID=UPI001B8D6F33|nr:hypothetical protein [Porphyromonas levii]MBR8769691.1 hypothetical protein [Porphyromonas levii]MBR8783988.1 hypothetical protein [Porphyromonas levii]